jgi:hypothetical protein
MGSGGTVSFVGETQTRWNHFFLRYIRQQANDSAKVKFALFSHATILPFSFFRQSHQRLLSSFVQVQIRVRRLRDTLLDAYVGLLLSS